MADDQNGRGWSKLLDRLQDPVDWVAAGVGALGGLAVSVAVGGTDLGVSAAAGAMVGVTAKASGEALLERPRLRKRAERLSENIRASIAERPERPDLYALAGALEANKKLWLDNIDSNKKFADELDALVDRYRSILIELAEPKQLPAPERARQEPGQVPPPRMT